MTDSSERNSSNPEFTQKPTASVSAEVHYLSSAAAMQAFDASENQQLSQRSNLDQKLDTDGDEQDFDSREGVSMCNEHNEPLNFWSKKLNRYQCIRCLVDEKEVHYIDKSYSVLLEKFKSIEKYGQRTLEENAPMQHVIHDWKGDIREILGRIHSQFIEMISDYTRKFYRSLVNIEMSSQMKQFYREDSRQNQRIEYMKQRYIEIKAIIDEIEQTQPNLKAAAVRSHEEQMEKLNSEFIAKDKEMKKMNLLLQQAMMRTVEVEPLSERIFCKYQKYIDDQVKQLSKVILTPKSFLIPANLKIRVGAKEQLSAADE